MADLLHVAGTPLDLLLRGHAGVLQFLERTYQARYVVFQLVAPVLNFVQLILRQKLQPFAGAVYRAAEPLQRLSVRVFLGDRGKFCGIRVKGKGVIGVEAAGFSANGSYLVKLRHSADNAHYLDLQDSQTDTSLQISTTVSMLFISSGASW